MRKPKQLSFSKTDFKSRTEFGGSLLAGKRKEARPLSTKRPLHLVLKSHKARGLLSFINHRSSLEITLSKIASRFRIKIYDKAVNSDHIHMVISFKSKDDYKGFVRVLTAEIVRVISERTRIKEKIEEALQHFFTHRPYTKILSWGRQFRAALEYMILNQMECFGLRPRKSVGKPKRRERSAGDRERFCARGVWCCLSD